MKLLLTVGAVLCAASIVLARPKYFAIPVEDIQFLSFEPQQIRVPREAPVYKQQPQRESQYVQEEDADTAASEGRSARQAGHGGDHDYVDYGAHTGHHGAFGWYADFPVHAHDH